MDPNGKVAIVTGGASGIGLATGRLLATNGARVILADLQADLGQRASAGLGATGAAARFLRVDVLDPSSLQSMLDFAEAEFGRVDIVHNNAGVNEGGQNLFDAGADYWERTLDIDLKAVIRATRLEVRYFRERGHGGVIVNTASMGGLVPMPTSPVYAAAKAGVIHFTRSLAYLVSEGIRVNAVCPTFTDTPMVRVAGDEAIDMMKREVGGILQPEDVAAGVLELVRDDSRAGSIMRVTVRKGLDYTFEGR